MSFPPTSGMSTFGASSQGGGSGSSNSYSQGFGSNDMHGQLGGPGLGNSSSKTYSPYGDSQGNSAGGGMSMGS